MREMASRPLAVAAPEDVGGLTRPEIEKLGTTTSEYRTKVALVELCKHNGIVVVSNNSKPDVIKKLQSHHGPLKRVPSKSITSSPRASVTSETSRASRRGVVNPTVIDKEARVVSTATIAAPPAPMPASAPIPPPAPAPDAAPATVAAATSSAPLSDTRSASTASTAASKTVFENLRTLVVDDSLMNRKMLQRMLKLFDVPSDAAEDGQIAVDLVAAKGPNYYDVIFMDFTMPVMNGVEATKIIRSMGCTTKIIAVTGNAMEADVQALGEAGANRVILKPIRQNVLQEELAAVKRYQ